MGLVRGAQVITESWVWTWLLRTLGRGDGKPLVWVRPPILCIPSVVLGSSHCFSWARTSSSPFPEMALLVPAVLALERLELLPKPPPYPAEAGFSGNPQIQMLGKLDSPQAAWPHPPSLRLSILIIVRMSFPSSPGCWNPRGN